MTSPIRSLLVARGLLPMLTALPLLVGCGRSETPPAGPAPAESAAMAPAEAASKSEVLPELVVEGTALVLALPDGTRLRGTELAGAIVHLSYDGKLASLRLASIAPDPDDPQILRHDFEVADETGAWKSACEPNAYGERWGFPIALPPGHPGREGMITMTCVSGAVAKCARFGYKPWLAGPHGEDLTPLHAACVHMVRADYCGDNRTHTKNGTQIDMYDDLGIQRSEGSDSDGFRFEAGWTPRGAACVAHPRWRDLATLDRIRAECPRLAAAPACDEAGARAAGARLFNRSKLNG